MAKIKKDKSVKKEKTRIDYFGALKGISSFKHEDELQGQLEK